MKFITISIIATIAEGIRFIEQEWDVAEKNAIYKYSRQDEDNKTITHKIRKEELHTLIGTPLGITPGCIHNKIVTTPDKVEEAKAMLKEYVIKIHDIQAKEVAKMAEQVKTIR